jgi:hypothetical protein
MELPLQAYKNCDSGTQDSVHVVLNGISDTGQKYVKLNVLLTVHHSISV